MSEQVLNYSEAHQNGFWHEWMRDTRGILVGKVDKFFGTWPNGYEALAFYHSGFNAKGRVMKFFLHPVRNEWWTTVLTRCQYLDLKEEQKQKQDEIRLGGVHIR